MRLCIDNSVEQPGTHIPVQMGVQYNTTAAATLNWVLYNQTALPAIQLSKKVTELNDLGIEKGSEELAAEVAKLYFLAVATAHQKVLISELFPIIWGDLRMLTEQHK